MQQKKGYCTGHVASRHNMKIKLLLLWSVAVSVCTRFTSVSYNTCNKNHKCTVSTTIIIQVRANFVLRVNFINYTNPTGLCAECAVLLSDVASVDQLVPVCCDDQPFRNTNCNNTGEESCNTRFRWTIRPFGASLETRPVTMPFAANPPYFFTDCTLSPTLICPFSEMSRTFLQDPLGFLGVASNPLPVVSRTMWTVSYLVFEGK